MTVLRVNKYSTSAYFVNSGFARLFSKVEKIFVRYRDGGCLPLIIPKYVMLFSGYEPQQIYKNKLLFNFSLSYVKFKLAGQF